VRVAVRVVCWPGSDGLTELARDSVEVFSTNWLSGLEVALVRSGLVLV
jgi:hypothetical protein